MTTTTQQIRDAFTAAREGQMRSFTLRGREITLRLRHDVFPPLPISLAIADAIPSLNGLVAADLGTGTGIIAAGCAIAGAASVLATDNNASAVELANENFAINSLSDNSHAVRANWIPTNGTLFDFLVSNPPCMPMAVSAQSLPFPRSLYDAVDGGSDGTQPTFDVIRCASHRLRIDGMLLLPIAEWANTTRLYSTLVDSKFSYEVLRTIQVPYWIPEVFPADAAITLDTALNTNACNVHIVLATKL